MSPDGLPCAPSRPRERSNRSVRFAAWQASPGSHSTASLGSSLASSTKATGPTGCTQRRAMPRSPPTYSPPSGMGLSSCASMQRSRARAGTITPPGSVYSSGRWAARRGPRCQRAARRLAALHSASRLPRLPLAFDGLQWRLPRLPFAFDGQPPTPARAAAAVRTAAHLDAAGRAHATALADDRRAWCHPPPLPLTARRTCPRRLQ